MRATKTYWIDVDTHTEKEVNIPNNVTKEDIKRNISTILSQLDEQGYFKEDTDVDIDIRGMGTYLSIRVSTLTQDEILKKKN